MDSVVIGSLELLEEFKILFVSTWILFTHFNFNLAKDLILLAWLEWNANKNSLGLCVNND